MKRMHTTSTKETPQQESNPHTTTEATEDPTTPKAKRVRPTSRAKDSPMNTDMDKDDSEKEENPGIPRFLFSGTATQGSDSIQRMDKLRKFSRKPYQLWVPLSMPLAHPFTGTKQQRCLANRTLFPDSKCRLPWNTKSKAQWDHWDHG